MSARAKDWLRQASRAYDAAMSARDLAGRAATSGRGVATGARAVYDRLNRGSAAGGGARAARTPLITGRDVIHGDEDPLAPLEHGVATADAIPGARLLRLSGAGHVDVLNRPDLILPSMLALFSPRTAERDSP